MTSIINALCSFAACVCCFLVWRWAKDRYLHLLTRIVAVDAATPSTNFVQDEDALIKNRVASLEAKLDKIDKTLTTLDGMLGDVADGGTRNDDQIRLVGEELNKLKSWRAGVDGELGDFKKRLREDYLRRFRLADIYREAGADLPTFRALGAGDALASIDAGADDYPARATA